MKIRAERVYLFGFTENNPAGGCCMHHAFYGGLYFGRTSLQNMIRFTTVA